MNSRGSLRPLTSLFCVLLLQAGIFAVAVRAEGGDPAGHPREGVHPNRHLALFVGASAADGHRYAAVGGDFEHRFSHFAGRFGLAVGADVVLAEHPHVLVAAGAVLHPGGGLKLLAMPGVAVEEGHPAFALRTGIGYDLHVGGFSVSPTLNFDFVDGHVAKVFGLAFGIGG